MLLTSAIRDRLEVARRGESGSPDIHYASGLFSRVSRPSTCPGALPRPEAYEQKQDIARDALQ